MNDAILDAIEKLPRLLVMVPVHTSQPEAYSEYITADDLKALRTRLLEAEGKVAKCVWTTSGDEYGPQYETSCDQAFDCENDGVKENKFQFCIYCGGRIVERHAPNEGGERDPSLISMTPDIVENLIECSECDDFAAERIREWFQVAFEDHTSGMPEYENHRY
jgi:hypothetical protein